MVKILDRVLGRKEQPLVGQRSAKLTTYSRVIRGMIRTYGLVVVRRQVIRAIDDDCDRIAKRVVHLLGSSATVADMMQDKIVLDALATPEYVALLKDLDLNAAHIESAAREALQRTGVEVA